MLKDTRNLTLRTTNVLHSRQRNMGTGTHTQTSAMGYAPATDRDTKVSNGGTTHATYSAWEPG